MPVCGKDLLSKVFSGLVWQNDGIMDSEIHERENAHLEVSRFTQHFFTALAAFPKMAAAAFDNNSCSGNKMRIDYLDHWITQVANVADDLVE